MITIEVTQEHIDKGNALHAHSCPISLALTAAGVAHLAVGPTTIVCPEYNIDLPEPLARFIRAFDRGEKVWPITFELETGVPESRALVLA